MNQSALKKNHPIFYRSIVALCCAVIFFLSVFGGVENIHAQAAESSGIDAAGIAARGGFAGGDTQAINELKGNADIFAWFKPQVWVAYVVGWFGGIIIQIEGFFIIALNKFLLFIFKFSNITNVEPVRIGWTLVRDIANLFFVVILLAIAIATILRVESYNFKRLLPKLILMAILVNFSKTIAQIIIDFAQVIMSTFVAAFASVTGEGNLVNTLQINEIITYNVNADDPQLLKLAGSIITAVIMLAIALVVIGVILAILLMRIVMLWLLIILSPLAYILAAFPQGEKYASQWWQEFTKNVIVGPVLAFFLWLTFAIASSGSIADKTFGQQNFSQNQGIALNQGAPLSQGVENSISDPSKFFSFIIAIAMLMGSLVVTQQIGAAGSGVAGNAFSRIRQTGLKAAVRIPLGLGSWTARKIKTGKVPLIGKYTRGLELNPYNIVQGIKESMADRRRNEDMQGRGYAVQAMKKGGPIGLLKGLGSARDWGDAYIKGGFNVRGFSRMAGTVLGGPEKVAKIMEEAEDEKNYAAYTQQEADMRRAALAKPDNFDVGKSEYVKENLEAKKDEIEARRLSGGTAADENYRFTTDDKGVVKKEFIDDVMKKEGISPLDISALRAAGKHDEANKKSAFLDEWDTERATKELTTTVDEAKQKGSTGTAAQQAIMVKVEELAKKSFEDLSVSKKAEAVRVAGGGMTGQELKERQSRLLEINKDMARLLRQIRNKKARGESTVALEENLEKDKKERAEIGVQKLNSQGVKVWQVNEDAIVRDVSKTKDAREREEMEKRIKDSTQEAELDSKKYALFAKAPTMTTAERDTLRTEADQLEKEAQGAMTRFRATQQRAEYYRPPQGFYGDRDRRALENEYQAKIHTELDSELIAGLRDALSEGDSIKGTAIMKKITQDANDNELWNDFGFGSDSEGMHKFFDAVMMGKKDVKLADGTTYKGPSFGLDEQTALSIENDVGFLNESVNHWETARVVEVKNGQYVRLSPLEHAMASLAEIMKKNPREISRSFNRLAYGGENPKAGGGREFFLTPLGMGILKALGPEIGEQIKKGTEYNKNMVMNVGRSGVMEQMERAGGVDPVLMESMGSTYKKLESEAGIGVQKILSSFFDKFIEDMEKLETRHK